MDTFWSQLLRIWSSMEDYVKNMVKMWWIKRHNQIMANNVVKKMMESDYDI
jgi:hypothetical protein